MDRGFEGVLAVAVLGCAVILAIAFQISEGLAIEGESRGTLAPSPPRADAEPTGQPPKPAQTMNAAADEAEAWESGTGPAAIVTVDQAETTPHDSTDIDPPAGLVLATSGPGTKPSAGKGMPAATGEINPAEGHTVSLHPADEMGEPRRISPPRRDEFVGMPNMTASDHDSSNALGAPAPNGTFDQAADTPPPAVEMIRGIRRSSEAIAVTEKED